MGYNRAMFGRLLLQAVVSLLLIGLVLLQSSGSGFGKSWGGVGYHSRKGLEKIIFVATIVLAVLFGALSLLNTLV